MHLRCLSGCLLRLQTASHLYTRPHQQNSQTSAAAALVYASCVVLDGWRGFAFRVSLVATAAVAFAAVAAASAVRRLLWDVCTSHSHQPDFNSARAVRCIYTSPAGASLLLLLQGHADGAVLSLLLHLAAPLLLPLR